MGSDIVDSIQLGNGGTCRIIHNPVKSSRARLINQLKAGAFIIFIGGLIAFLQTFGYESNKDGVCALWLSLALLIAVYIFMLCSLLKNEFILRQQNLSLPFAYWFATNGHLRWNWSQLQRVVFARSSAADEMPNRLLLYFDRGKGEAERVICINHDAISEVDLKKFVYAVVNNAPLAAFDPPLSEVELSFPTVSGIKHLNFQSFTSPLGRRVFLTIFSDPICSPR